MQMNPSEIDLRQRARTQALLQAQLGETTSVGPALDATLATDQLQRFVDACVQRHYGQIWTAQQAQWWAHCQRVLVDNFGAQPQIPLQADPVLLPLGAASGPLSYDLVALLRPMHEAWDEAQELDWAVRYWEQARRTALPVPLDFGEFWQQLEWTGLQRHLSLLGALCGNTTVEPAELPLLMAHAIKVATRYKQLSPLAQLLGELRGGLLQAGFR